MAIQYDEELVKESMELLDEYDYEPERYAVKKILNTWAENKEWIVHLFEHHPNYNGKYQIVFSDTFTREIDRDECRAFYNWILRSDWDTRETAVNGIYASAIFDKLLNWPKRFLDDEDDVIISWLNRFDDHFGAKAGQKVSRVINKLCKMVGLDKATEYNARFARVADALNPIKIVRHTILSVHDLGLQHIIQFMTFLIQTVMLIFQQQPVPEILAVDLGIQQRHLQARCTVKAVEHINIICFLADADIAFQQHDMIADKALIRQGLHCCCFNQPLILRFLLLCSLFQICFALFIQRTRRFFCCIFFEMHVTSSILVQYHIHRFRSAAVSDLWKAVPHAKSETGLTVYPHTP